MTVSTPTYCSREDVKSALDINETARNNVQIDRAIETASRAVEGLCHRTFYPQTDVRYFDWPNYQYAQPWRLWFEQNEVVSVNSLTTAGVSIPASGYFLEPVNSGPPFNRVELNQATTYAFDSADTQQRSIAVSGVFGYDNNTVFVATLEGSINDSVASLVVSDASTIGVGNLLLMGSERLLVTDKTMLDVAQNLQSDLTPLSNNVTVSVSSGSEFHVGEILLLDAERMLIVDIAGNNLIVKRAWDGSVLAAHSGSDIYALRTLTVARGVTGTAAASHLDGAEIDQVIYPALVRELCVAEAVNSLIQESSGYARTSSGQSNNPSDIGRGLQGIRDYTLRTYGRKSRMRAI